MVNADALHEGNDGTDIRNSASEEDPRGTVAGLKENLKKTEKDAMKRARPFTRILAVLLTLTVLFTLLASCAGDGDSVGGDGGTGDGGTVGTNPLANINGKELAKLLLAGERLQIEKLGEGNIFDNGVSVMQTLIERATENLDATYVGEVNGAIELSRDYSNVLGEGTFVEDGEVGKWSDFPEYSNSYTAFEGTTKGIIRMAEEMSALIDFIKKNVRVVDKWVTTENGYGPRYFLHVDENSEILCEDLSNGTRISICRRYKNENGKDVYEMYTGSLGGGFKTRMTYIPGERYEMSSRDGGERSGNYFVADNSKGYWETYTVGEAPAHYNVSHFILKDDICYDAFYDPDARVSTFLKVMSEDRKTDILNFMISPGADSVINVDLKLSGFDGVKHIEAPMDKTTVDETGVAYPEYGTAVVVTENGKRIAANTKYYDERLTVEVVRVSHFSFDGYAPEIALRIDSSSREEQMALLTQFIADMGLVCRRPLAPVLAGISRAYSELDVITRRYKWHGVSVATNEGIAEAIEIENARFGEMWSLYTDASDAPSVILDGSEAFELSMSFAALTQLSAQGVRTNGMEISLEHISLTVNDLLLFVEGEPYRIALALARTDGKGGLVHLALSEQRGTPYARASDFTVTGEALSTTLPEALTDGEYTLVAYIATSDGVRSSDYTAIDVAELAGETVHMAGSHRATLQRGEDGRLSLTYETLRDFELQITTDGTLDYEAFRYLLDVEAFVYGTTVGEIEESTDDGFVALTGEETAIGEGVYRIAYEAGDGEDAVRGTILFRHTVEQQMKS